MKNITFQEKSAQNIYDSYLRRVRRTVSILSVSDREDLLMEFNSHIYEGLQQGTNEGEVATLLKITQQLGDPEEVLKPMVAERKLNQATKTFNPKHIFQAIFLNLKNGIQYTVFAILYICLFAFGFLTILKILYPNDTGLFLKDGKFAVLGVLKTSEPVEEVLGHWFIPTMFISALVLYIMLTLFLRMTKKK